MFYDDLFTPVLEALAALDGMEYTGLCFAPPDNLENLVHGHLPACRVWLERLDWRPNLAGTALAGEATLAVALLANPAKTDQEEFLNLMHAVVLTLNEMTTGGGLFWKLRSEQSYGSQSTLGHIFRFTSSVERN